MNGLLEAAALAVALLAAGSWLVVSLWVRQPAAKNLGTGQRAARARLWLYAPFWLPLATLAAVLAPGLVDAALGRADHCIEHAGHQHHLCLIHPSPVAHQPLSLLVLIAAGIAGLALVVQTLKRTGREHRLAKALVGLSEPSTLGADIRVLDQTPPIALTLGIRRPVILLSRGLLEAASPETLRSVIAHERAHIERRDTTWATLDRLAATILPSRSRIALLNEISLAREQACDAMAAQVEGRIEVARALTQVARMGMARVGLTPPGVAELGLSVAASSLEARVLYLLDPPRLAPRRSLWPWLLLAAAVVLGAGPVHRAIERAISILLH